MILQAYEWMAPVAAIGMFFVLCVIIVKVVNKNYLNRKNNGEENS